MTGALVAVAVAALALAGGGFGGVALGVTTALVWLALLVLVLAGRLPTHRPGAGLSAAAGCLLALLALTVLSTGWTSSDGAAFAEAVRLAGYLGALLLAGLLARRDRLGPALGGIAAAGVAIALVALASRLLGIGAGDIDLVDDLPTAAGRLSFPLGYWNALGALLALSVPPLCWLAGHLRAPRWSGIALAGFPPLVGAAYLTSSRGAVLAVVLGIAVTIGCSAERRRTAAAAAIGLALSAPVLIAATLADGILDSPGDGSPGGPELITLAATLAGSAAALLGAGRMVGRLSRSRPFSVSLQVRHVLAAAAAALAALIILAGPSALISDLRAGNDAENSAGNDRATGIVSASGSGRAQFWETALDAFAEDPVRGVGAGGFADYWNEHGSMKAPARNAHSEPLEAIAELGLLGFACLAGLLVTVAGCAISRVGRTDPAEGAGAAVGLLAAAAVGFTIDWTWQFPAIAVPVLIVAGMSCDLAQPGRLLARAARLSPRVLAGAAIVVAVPAVWAAGVLAASTARLQDGAEALAEGRLNDAAAATRSAAAIQPWAEEPWIQLAQIELEAGNLDASRAASEQAIRRNGASLPAWTLATSVQVLMGNGDVSVAYGLRAADRGLGP